MLTEAQLPRLLPGSWRISDLMVQTVVSMIQVVENGMSVPPTTGIYRYIPVPALIWGIYATPNSAQSPSRRICSTVTRKPSRLGAPGAAVGVLMQLWIDHSPYEPFQTVCPLEARFAHYLLQPALIHPSLNHHCLLASISLIYIIIIIMHFSILIYQLPTLTAPGINCRLLVDILSPERVVGHFFW